jgi:DNA-directed RNA polymerase subunit RPC12/RpoP
LPYCSECGTEVQDTASFCSDCGADLSDLLPAESTEVAESDTEDDASTVVDSATTEHTDNSWEIEGEEVDPKVLVASIYISILSRGLLGLDSLNLGVLHSL